MSFSMQNKAAFDAASDRYHSALMPDENRPPLLRCPHCGKRLEPNSLGIVAVFNTVDGYVHEKCFKTYMDAQYGEGGWRPCENDGMGGYYEFNYCGDGEHWEGTGNYYTEFEYADDCIIFINSFNLRRLYLDWSCLED